MNNRSHENMNLTNEIAVLKPDATCHPCACRAFVGAGGLLQFANDSPEQHIVTIIAGDGIPVLMSLRLHEMVEIMTRVPMPSQ